MVPRIGTAGWGIPRPSAGAFPTAGTLLERYAAVLPAVEINSTFYRSHRRPTYERWAAAVPETFRFAVKVPRAVTHVARLVACEAKVDTFLEEIAPLGPRLGPLLLQLPPSLAFEPAPAEAVCARLMKGGLALCCEPRHPSWLTAEADAWLAERQVARVAADPARHPGAGEPGGWRGLTYRRLHGAPRLYFSAYDNVALDHLAMGVARDAAADVWCVFDNTGSGAAAADALALKSRLDANAPAGPA